MPVGSGCGPYSESTPSIRPDSRRGSTASFRRHPTRSRSHLQSRSPRSSGRFAEPPRLRSGGRASSPRPTRRTRFCPLVPTWFRVRIPRSGSTSSVFHFAVDRSARLCYDRRAAIGGTLKGKVLTYALRTERAGEDFFSARSAKRRWDEGIGSFKRRRATFREEENMAVAEESWTKKYLGEVLGVFVLVFLGDSFVAYAVSGGKNGFLAGLLAAGFFWGFAVTFAIYACG